METVLHRVSSPKFVGRATELEALDAALRCAQGGTPAFVFVAGESGVGKSRLVSELETRAGAAGARVLIGNCVELAGSEVPYAALMSALRPIARELAECGSDLREQLVDTRGALYELLPELGGERQAAATESDDRAGRQARVFEALLTLIERLGKGEPVVLALEDIHWADASTRDFLVFLVRTARTERLCLVVTYRSDELHRRHPLRPLLAELERSVGVERLTIERFTRPEVVEQLTGILGATPDADLVDRLFARSQGNPLYTEELLAVTAEGACEMPETLRDALLTRVERLSPVAQDVVRLASISARPTRHELLQAVSTLPPDELLCGLREAVAHQVLVPAEGDAYAFRHALVGEAVDEDLLPGERSALHAAMAAAIEAQPELVGDLPPATMAAKLAGHWYHAHDLPHALASSVRAGIAAKRVYAFSEARRQLERALELWDRVPDAAKLAGMDRVELLREAASAASTIGEATRAVALMRQAIELVDEAAEPRRAALLYVELGRYLGRGPDSLDAFQRALDLLPADAPAIDRAQVHEAYAKVLMLTSRNDEAIRMAQEAIEAACAVGDEPGLESRALVTLGLVHAARGDVDGAARMLRRSADLALQRDRHSDYVRAIIHLTEALDGNGRTPEALEIAREALERTVRQRPEHTSYDLFLELQAANHLERLGRLTEAWDGLPERVPADPADSASRYAHELRARIAIARGDIPTAHEHVDGLRRAGASVLEPHWIEPVYRLPAELALLEGRHDDARAAIAEGLPLVEQSEDMLLILRLCWTGLRVEADIAARARALGDPVDMGRARRLEAAVARVADRPQWREGPAFATLARAELARLRHEAGDAPPDAPAWAAAAAAFDELQHPWPAAYARFRHAEALVAGGAFSDAAEPLRAACTAAAAMGAAPLHGEIAALARRARIVLDGPAPAASEASAADRLGLTPREREVLLLVADGCTNREIGASLYMSEKTASVHVSRILAKLGVSRRVEAAAVAHRTGLTAEAEAAGA